jgi:hypothetical protein
VWRAGDVLVSAGEGSTFDLLSVHPEGHPLPFTLVPRDKLLDMSRFLKQQPSKNFWGLRRLNVLSLNYNVEYLENATTESWGNLPFRFESLGELVYYCKLHSLITSSYWVVHFEYLPDLVTAHSIKLFQRNRIENTKENI